MPTAPDKALPMPRGTAGSPRGGRCGSRRRPSRELISTTCCSVGLMCGPWRRAMSPPDRAEGARDLIFGAEEMKPEPPRPLMRELAAADPFPIDALGNVLGSAARAIHDRVQAPLAIGAHAVLGAAAL